MNIINAKDISQGYLTVLVYATPGMGKTTMLGNLKGRTLILDFDRGTSVLSGNENVDVARLSVNSREVFGAVNELKTNCNYANVCIDSLSELERAILSSFATSNSNGIPGIQDYGKVNAIITDLCRRLREVKANIFLTAWEQYTDISAPNGEKYSRIEPMIRQKNLENICGLCDIIGRIYVDKDTQERRLWLHGMPNVIAKDRVFKRQSCELKEVIPNG